MFSLTLEVLKGTSLWRTIPTETASLFRSSVNVHKSRVMVPLPHASTTSQGRRVLSASSLVQDRLLTRGGLPYRCPGSSSLRLDRFTRILGGPVPTSACNPPCTKQLKSSCSATVLLVALTPGDSGTVSTVCCVTPGYCLPRPLPASTLHLTVLVSAHASAALHTRRSPTARLRWHAPAGGAQARRGSSAFPYTRLSDRSREDAALAPRSTGRVPSGVPSLRRPCDFYSCTRQQHIRLQESHSGTAAAALHTSANLLGHSPGWWGEGEGQVCM